MSQQREAQRRALVAYGIFLSATLQRSAFATDAEFLRSVGADPSAVLKTYSETAALARARRADLLASDFSVPDVWLTCAVTPRELRRSDERRAEAAGVELQIRAALLRLNAVAAAETPADADRGAGWLTLTEIVRVLDVDKGKLSRACSEGNVRSMGRGRDRRIDANSAAVWKLAIDVNRGW